MEHAISTCPIGFPLSPSSANEYFTILPSAWPPGSRGSCSTAFLRHDSCFARSKEQSQETVTARPLVMSCERARLSRYSRDCSPRSVEKYERLRRSPTGKL